MRAWEVEAILRFESEEEPSPQLAEDELTCDVIEWLVEEV